jgi:hypothetical protein
MPIKLTWTEPKKPGPDCHYDNTEAETPFGVYLITWKSWKNYPDYCIDFQSEFVGAGSTTLDDAKSAAQIDFEERLKACHAAGQ